MYLGCGGYFKGSKQTFIDNPLDNASRMQALNEARQDLKRSKSEYNTCLKNNEDDVARCDNLKKQYESDVENYTSLQME